MLGHPTYYLCVQGHSQDNIGLDNVTENIENKSSQSFIHILLYKITKINNHLNEINKTQKSSW